MPLVDILNCRLILTAIGESIGSFCGGFFVPFLTSAFHATWMYWLALSIMNRTPDCWTEEIQIR